MTAYERMMKNGFGQVPHQVGRCGKFLSVSENLVLRELLGWKGKRTNKVKTLEPSSRKKVAWSGPYRVYQELLAECLGLSVRQIQRIFASLNDKGVFKKIVVAKTGNQANKYWINWELFEQFPVVPKRQKSGDTDDTTFDREEKQSGDTGVGPSGDIRVGPGGDTGVVLKETLKINKKRNGTARSRRELPVPKTGTGFRFAKSTGKEPLSVYIKNTKEFMENMKDQIPGLGMGRVDSSKKLKEMLETVLKATGDIEIPVDSFIDLIQETDEQSKEWRKDKLVWPVILKLSPFIDGLSELGGRLKAAKEFQDRQDHFDLSHLPEIIEDLKKRIMKAGNSLDREDLEKSLVGYVSKLARLRTRHGIAEEPFPLPSVASSASPPVSRGPNGSVASAEPGEADDDSLVDELLQSLEAR